MSALTSLLVRDQQVPVRKIEEAIQRQVISGGGLDTVLLELAAVPEDVLAAYCAAVYGLLPATRDEVMKVSRDTVRIVPREVAERHRLVPLASEEGTLVVAVSDPLDEATESQLAFLLGVEVVQRIVTEARLVAALHHHYGVEMPPRMRRLTEKLRQRDAGKVPFVAPLEINVAEREEEEDDDEDYDNEDDEDEASEGGPSTKRMGVVSADEPTDNETVRMSVSQVVGVRKSARPPPPAAGTSTPPSPRRAKDRGQVRRISRPQSKALRKNRGPLTARRAVDVLGEAEVRDDILEVGFAFAKQFFDYTALFVVHEDEAECIDAVGPGAGYEEVCKLSVPLGDPSALAMVVEGVVPLVTHLDQTDPERKLRAGLERLDAMPAVLVPVAIRSRVVLVFYGDRSGDDFGLQDVPELLAFAPRLSEAFQQLILRRKLRAPVEEEAAPRKEGGGKAPRLSKPPKATTLRPPAPAPAEAVQIPSTSPAADPRVEPEPEPEPPDLDEPSALERAVRTSLPPAIEDEPAEEEASAEPAEPAKPARKRRVRKRSAAFDVLGVPRSAPPPPKPGALPAVASAAAAVEVAIETDEEDDDDEPEIEVAEADASDFDDVEVLESVGHYSMGPGSEEQIAPLPTGKDLPRAPRVDPRSEGGPRPTADVVKSIEGITPASSPSARRTSPGGERAPSSPAPTDLPKVMIEIDPEIEKLVRQLQMIGPDDESNTIQSVLAAGEPALPVLIQSFPGPLWFDRHRPHRRLPRGRDVSAIARALAAFGDQAVPYVVTLLDHRLADTRFYATLLSSEFSHRQLVGGLGRRIFDEDPKTAALALDVLRVLQRFDREMTDVVQMVRATARVPRRSPDHRARAARALGELRDAGSLELLIDLLEGGADILVQSAHIALVILTRQDFGPTRSRWMPWFEANRERHRIEWLIDGLMHDDEALRTAAADELMHLTQEYYGYHPRLPKHDREIAQRKYRRWWESEGHRRFG